MEHSFCIFPYAEQLTLHVTRTFLALLLTIQLAAAQDTSRVDGVRLAVLSGVFAGTVTAIHFYQQQAWWLGSRGEFWFVNDWDYSRGVDKLGHAYGSYIITHLSSYALQWSGLTERKALLFGAISALGFELYIEIEDGFHNNYGFSPGDFFADVAGAALPLAQYRFPVLQNFRMKWSYWPSKAYLDDIKSGKNRVFMNDYEGQTYWLAVDPHFLMGPGLRKVVPAWLGIAVGRGVRGAEEGVGNGTPITYIALDYNLSRIETESGFLKGLFRALDFFHLPAPGISIQNGKVKFGVLF